jgi:hypothetical protein
MLPHRTQNVHNDKRRSQRQSGAAVVTHCLTSGRGGIRTHGTLSRTHTFQANGVLLADVRPRADEEKTCADPRTASIVATPSRLRAGSYTARTQRAPSSLLADSLICARCDGAMVLTPDAIGRLRKRCPTCDGVAKVRHHPDQVLVPQTLVRLTADALPHVEPGQLRCQRCAKGVDGNVRFHTECAAAAALEKKQRPCGCGARFVRPSGSHATECPTCLAARTAPATTQLCTGCNRIRPRLKHMRAVVGRCTDCRPKRVARVPKAKPPQFREGCGHAFPYAVAARRGTRG